MADKISSTRWSVRHVQSINDLPAKLIIGRAYFVGDGQYIVIDHGNGPVIYGERAAGPQGRPGEPIPELQAQIDALAQAAIQNSDSIQTINAQRRTDYKALQESRANDLTGIYEQIKNLSAGLIEISDVIAQTSKNLRDTENIILKVILEANAEHSIAPFDSNDTITSSDGTTWKILDSSGNKNEGTIIFSKN